MEVHHEEYVVQYRLSVALGGAEGRLFHVMAKRVAMPTKKIRKRI